jgi:dTDP-glucose pyrophosphorylase
MKPYTDTYQKTMIPIHNKPLLEYIVKGLIFAGFKELIIVVGYRKEQIMDYFKEGSKWGVRIEYVEQKEINGTGGALLICEKHVNDSHLFLTWGDILVPYKIYKQTYDTYKKEHHDFVLVANVMTDPFKGAAIYCKGNYLADIMEKPPKGTAKSNLNNCGVFIFSKNIFEVLKTLKPSPRGEIELPDAITIGIKEKKWKIWVLKMDEHEFRGDFGDLETYERLKVDPEWLEYL